MNSYKYLTKNIGLLTLSNFGTRILSFFLVPLYTSVLTTKEYGTYDLLNTTILLLIPFFTLNIADGVIRFSLDKESNKKGIFTIGIKVLWLGFIPILVITIINFIFDFIPILKEYVILFLLLYLVTALQGIITSFTRGIERIVDISVSGILCSIAIIVLSFAFLLGFKMGIQGYFLANILGSSIQVLYLYFRCELWTFFDWKYTDSTLRKRMVNYSKPLIANSVAWWINNASDRYIVTFFCGIVQNGIYSVGYKIPSILNLFQTIFNQAWVLSAVKDFDPEDKDGFFSKMYNSYNCLMVMVCSGIIACDRILAYFLYGKAFYTAWKYVPFLSIAIVFGALSGYIGGIFSAVKDSKIFAHSTVIGAVCNVILNVILVYKIGAMGAAIATAFSYFIVWIIRLVHMKKYLNIKLYLTRDFCSYILLIIQTVVMLYINGKAILYIIQTGLLFILILLFNHEISNLIGFAVRRIKNRRL